MVMNEAFLFAKIDTRCLRADKSNSEDRQKLVHFCPTVYILYALFLKYREKKDFFVYHFFVFVVIPSPFFKQFLFFRNVCRLFAKTIVLKELDRCFKPQAEVLVVTGKEQA
jgi:hypothetical protein